MRDETVRRVYIGGKIEASRERAAVNSARPPFLQIEDVSVFYGTLIRSSACALSSAKMTFWH